jgi:hypothetical protein
MSVSSMFLFPSKTRRTSAYAFPIALGFLNNSNIAHSINVVAKVSLAPETTSWKKILSNKSINKECYRQESWEMKGYNQIVLISPVRYAPLNTYY